MPANLVPSETPITESRLPLLSSYPSNEPTLLPLPQTGTLQIVSWYQNFLLHKTSFSCVVHYISWTRTHLLCMGYVCLWMMKRYGTWVWYINIQWYMVSLSTTSFINLFSIHAIIWRMKCILTWIKVPHTYFKDTFKVNFVWISFLWLLLHTLSPTSYVYLFHLLSYLLY